MMKPLFRRFPTVASVLTLLPVILQAGTFADSIVSLNRGTFPGDFPGQFYGGIAPEAFPVVLDVATASASVLGAPDGRYLSLPGGPALQGAPFLGAYVELTFDGNFDINTLVTIWEAGDQAELAEVLLWTDTGSNIQAQIGTNPSGVITLDLRPFASFLTTVGGSSFTKIGIVGLDQLGPSQGFDLDAVSISPVPESSTCALFAAGLGVLGCVARSRRSRS